MHGPWAGASELLKCLVLSLVDAELVEAIHN